MKAGGARWSSRGSSVERRGTEGGKKERRSEGKEAVEQVLDTRLYEDETAGRVKKREERTRKGGGAWEGNSDEACAASRSCGK